ncbi:30S ribosomal protein S2 [Rubrivirga sp. SAORIC476]|uniref:30S ribosomal protein S2 n=1 Tax=Rubrivirga sp. SAORIC476 TaxID=1961794 RepID=UPI000BA999D2|nr:30S ribosomal protein S2 [Rubrivirga sp. SAORIC476]MAQ95850.1 30S ribosomal protein S2 [Rhodothermaceae bacterium]MBC12626.1 30S ribosomal protein S2 [Rhodothermaceae bacterium]PAP81714.1 30S ribosomal protein S2 [Rubrivirga sp. SAORIC476]
MARASIEDLLRAGAHFGHLTSRWNPKMAPYIFMQRNGIHILDLKQTQALLDQAADAAGRFASKGRKVLFIGTKKQAQNVVREEAERAGMPFVVDRWQGGMMTNFATIRGSLRRMETLRREEADGTTAKLKKKERLMRSRELEKLDRVLGGISDMGKLPGAVFVVDIKREHIAVDEARKLNIPIIALVDSNVDPDLVDFPIPANDDAMKSVALFTRAIADAIIEGQKSGAIERDAAVAEAQSRAADEVKADQAEAAAEEAEPVTTMADAEAEAKTQAIIDKTA